MRYFTSFGDLVRFLLLAFLACRFAEAAQPPLHIQAVNYPLAYFAERIGGSAVHVGFDAPDSIDPAFWNPSPEEIATFQSADLILLNGAGYAKWTSKVSLPRSRLVDTSRSFRDSYIEQSDGVRHQHGGDGLHDHAGVAFTTWLDFSLAQQQAEAITQAMIRARPESSERFQKNFQLLQADLLHLDNRLTELSQQNPDLLLLGSHPVYQYPTARYQLNLKSVLWEPDQMPEPAQWQELETILVSHPAHWMLWESTPEADIAEQLGQLGIQSKVLDPCANRPETGDFLSVMEENIANLEQVFRQG